MSNPKDICANRHKGNAESVAANPQGFRKRTSRNDVWVACHRSAGATCRELADEWGVGMNQISGRFSELKKAGMIYRGKTRHRCGVYHAIKG